MAKPQRYGSPARWRKLWNFNARCHRRGWRLSRQTFGQMPLGREAEGSNNPEQNLSSVQNLRGLQRPGAERGVHVGGCPKQIWIGDELSAGCEGAWLVFYFVHKAEKMDTATCLRSAPDDRALIEYARDQVTFPSEAAELVPHIFAPEAHVYAIGNIAAMHEGPKVDKNHMTSAGRHGEFVRAPVLLAFLTDALHRL
jgi:hypothetical protein